jgi:hypothetical protein
LLAIVLLVAVIVAAVLGSHGRSVSSTIHGHRLSVSFGYRVPSPPSGAGIDPNNGWIVSAAGTTVAVYAGSQATDHLNGLLVIDRSSGGSLKLRSVLLRGTGPLTLVDPLPAVPTSRAAAAAIIDFVAANGATGRLDLATGHASLSSH